MIVFINGHRSLITGLAKFITNTVIDAYRHTFLKEMMKLIRFHFRHLVLLGTPFVL